MAVFISVVTDPFAEVRQQAANRQPQINIRRPLRGIEIKKDTHAVMRILSATGEEIPLLDSSSPEVTDGIGRSSHYANFVVQQIDETRMEKQQIVETFGEDYVFFFGERPRFLNIQGILPNTKDFNWTNEFLANWEESIRGTKLVEQNARLYLYFDEIVVEGYPVSVGVQRQSMMPYHTSFTTQLFVTNYAILSTVGSVFFQQEAAARTSDTGLVPPTKEDQQLATQKAAQMGAGGGLNSFLAATSKFVNNATFSIQSTLENIRNTLYGRNLVIPNGLGNQLYTPPIDNLAKFPAQRINQPIHMMDDEYIERKPATPAFDESELKRARSELKLRSPEELENRARNELQKLGIDTTRRETTYLLLGRGAFAGLQTFGSFGVRQAEGALTVI